MMKQPKNKAKTIRMTLGFLILSLWKRTRSRPDSCHGSCEEEVDFFVLFWQALSYFITDKSIDPARWPLLLIITLYILACLAWRSLQGRPGGGGRVEAKDGARGAGLLARLSPVQSRCCRLLWKKKWMRSVQSEHRPPLCLCKGGIYAPEQALGRLFNPFLPKPWSAAPLHVVVQLEDMFVTSGKTFQNKF